MKKGIPGFKMPTKQEIEKGLIDAVNMGFMEIVPGKDGQPGFRLTPKGNEHVEKLIRDAGKKNGEV